MGDEYRRYRARRIRFWARFAEVGVYIVVIVWVVKTILGWLGVIE